MTQIYDLAIIGGGPAGYTAAERAAKNGLSTILFEVNALGGVCLNEGCVPTKTMLYSAKLYTAAQDAAKYGVSMEGLAVDLTKIVQRKNKVVRKLTAGIRAKMQAAGVSVVQGLAKIHEFKDDEITIAANDTLFSASKLLICSGSETVIPPIAGLSSSEFWTSKQALENKELPKSLIVIGGGVIGIEFACFFNALGTKVFVVEMMDEILSGMDKELSAVLRSELTKKGINFHLSTKVCSVEDGKVSIELEGASSVLEADKILVSVGRKPNTSDLFDAKVSLEMHKNGIKVNEFMQTSHPNCYACGDVTGFSLLAHTAVREAEVAVDHILCASDAAKMSYKAIPGVVYTNPEFAGVGMTEEALLLGNIVYKTKKLPLSYSGRFVAENETFNGICKIFVGDDDAILGVHIVGNPASEIIAIAAIAIEKGIRASELANMIFAHPTVGEIIKETLQH
ncbi:dihydrolipoyl dehydrogenase [Bacteroidales bacterium]|nr:dihydrolipoyl dehydrogenase [Bacteroidales bacterium]